MIDRYLASHQPAKIHIGCGQDILPGWLNTEHGWGPPPSILYLDATQPFPIPSDRFDFIFSEHMIEHVSVAEALNMMRECHRILKRGGRIRISTPPLEFLLNLVLRPSADHNRYAEFHYQEFLPDGPLKVPAAIVNDYYRKWGHQFVYDAPSLKLLFERSGFTSIEQCKLNESRHVDLKGIENDARMPPGMLALSTMTFEASKPH